MARVGRVVMAGEAVMREDVNKYVILASRSPVVLCWC